MRSVEPRYGGDMLVKREPPLGGDDVVDARAAAYVYAILFVSTALTFIWLSNVM